MATAQPDYDKLITEIIDGLKNFGTKPFQTVRKDNPKRTKWYQIWYPQYIYQDVEISLVEYESILRQQFTKGIMMMIEN